MRTGRLAVVWVIATSLLAYACAKGGGAADDTTGDDTAADDQPADDSGDDSSQPDAPESTADARPPADARVDAFIPPPPDAFVPPPPDAAVSNPPICDANSDCVEPDTCCFLLVCVDGTAIGAGCFPS